MLRTPIYYVNILDIILDFRITYRNAPVLCLHKTVNMVVFIIKSNENTYPKGKALLQCTELSL